MYSMYLSLPITVSSYVGIVALTAVTVLTAVTSLGPQLQSKAY